MALFEVYERGAYGRVVGVLVTSSEMTAVARVESLTEEGKEAWYEQIQ